MTLAVAEALSPNKSNLDMTLAVAEALSPNKPNLDMTLAVAEALSHNKPNLDMTLAVAEALSPNKPSFWSNRPVGAWGRSPAPPCIPKRQWMGRTEFSHTKYWIRWTLFLSMKMVSDANMEWNPQSFNPCPCRGHLPTPMPSLNRTPELPVDSPPSIDGGDTGGTVHPDSHR